jgi:GNAT superfamily N-acetyltransferase
VSPLARTRAAARPARNARTAERPGRPGARSRATVAPAWRIEPLTPERWDDFTTLFGPRGACAGCWCTWARFTHAEFKAASPVARRAAIRRVVHREDAPGLLAYDGEAPVGWIAVAPRATYRRYATSRALAPVDEQPVWSVPCFFVARTHRRRGLTVALLEAACAYARARGASIVEGYPVDTKGQRQAAAFVWTGLPPAFAAAGFREVERRTPTRPIMRRTLRPARKAARRG